MKFKNKFSYNFKTCFPFKYHGNCHELILPYGKSKMGLVENETVKLSSALHGLPCIPNCSVK